MKKTPAKTNVSVIGSSRASDKACEIAENTGRMLIDNGFRLVCGGKGGIMEAACRGASRSTHHSDGDIVGILPESNPSAANRYVDTVVPTGLGEARNRLVAHSPAVIAIGGGAGTLSEMSFAWLLNRLIIGFRVDGWSGRLAGERLDNKERISSVEDQIFGVDTAEDAAEHLELYLEPYVDNQP
jgi:uncharacterized protein (TIGR00725 family)